MQNKCIFSTKICTFFRNLLHPQNTRSIRFMTMVCSLSFALVLALFVSVISNMEFDKNLRQTQRQDAAQSLQILGSQINADLQNVIMFTDQNRTDSTVSSYLTSISDKKHPDKGQLALLVFRRISDSYYTFSIQNYVSRALISTSDGSEFLNLQPVPYYTSGVITRILMSSPAFESLKSAKDYIWPGIIDNPLSRFNNVEIIPIVRPIMNANASQEIGWIYLELSPSIITDRFQNFNLQPDAALYITFDGHTSYRYSSGKLVPAELPDKLVTYYLSNQNWSISLLPSRSELLPKRHYYIGIVLLIFSTIICMGLILYVVMNRLITKPVIRILAKLERTGKGDFRRDASIEWNNELGSIGRGINDLSENVSSLMEKKVQDEKVKQELKYNILLAQVNPHFLYNTLNTIKWMAAIQGADGISDMATALSRLMKNIAKGTESLIPLKDEFSLVDDYFTIMKYRYGGAIELEYIIDDNAVLECRIPRFSLQPIIENSIFHGIEPKGAAGIIQIHACFSGTADARLMLIEVRDNGIGMTQEVIDGILSGTETSTHEFFRKLGVSNVSQRIRYIFGEQYGLHIESVPGSYTVMRFSLPAITDENLPSSGKTAMQSQDIPQADKEAENV